MDYTPVCSTFDGFIRVVRGFHPWTRLLKAHIAAPLFLLLLLASGCAPTHVPLPVGVVPAGKPLSAVDEQYGHEVLGELSRQYPLSRDDVAIDRARAIVDRLARAAGADSEPWHVYLFDADSVKNAAATRGNHIFVWSGLLQYLRDDDELAVVLAHEMAHALAGHTAPNPAQESSRIIASALGATAGQAAAIGGAPGIVADIASKLIEAGIHALVINPTQRPLELEADQVGLFLMARAGYDPRAALHFWDRAKLDPELGDDTLQFLSTHPSSVERSVAIRKIVALAVEEYEDALFAERQSHSTRRWRDRSNR